MQNKTERVNSEWFIRCAMEQSGFI